MWMLIIRELYEENVDGFWYKLIASYIYFIIRLMQALTDQQQFGKADEMYDKCIDLEPDNATTYVHKG